jgi:ferredoxin-type protein NapG
MAISRRIFVLTLLGIAAGTKVCAGERFYLRPPGALPEDDFLARCNRCQRCVQVCPTRVIMPASFNQGLLAANTPIVSFERSYCNSCLKCGQVCPTGALRPVTEDILDIGVAEIVKESCVAWNWVGCTVCLDKCPLKAVYLDESKRPFVTPDLCNGCGICQHECPSTSLRRSIKGKGIVVKVRPASVPPRTMQKA